MILQPDCQSAATVVRSKDPKVIIEALVCNWLNVFEAPKKFYTDNGGEFANKELVELLENLGIEFKATAAESSFSNGINERHHAVIKTILNKIRHDYPLEDINVLVSYAIFAKNCLADKRGFTPHQGVYGHSPNIPSILSDNVCNSPNIPSILSDNVCNSLHWSMPPNIPSILSDNVCNSPNIPLFYQIMCAIQIQSMPPMK